METSKEKEIYHTYPDGTVFHVAEVENAKEISFVWQDAKNITIGEPHDDGADINYLVCKDELPYLLVEVYYDRGEPTLFSDNKFIIWHDFLLVARARDFFYIDLNTFETRKFDPQNKRGIRYFNGFSVVSGRLVISDYLDLYFIDDKCRLVWSSFDWLRHHG